MKNRKLNFKPEIESIITKCESCSLSMVDEHGMPYVIVMNFGYQDDHIYFHSARTGKKIDILLKNPNVCVAFSADHELRWVNEDVACSWGMKYRSVLAYGKVEFIDDFDKKEAALRIIMGNYSDREFTFNVPAVNDVMVFRVKVDTLEGRVYGY